jgi:predicted permease
MVVTPNYFRTLGVSFAAGRGFLDKEDVGGNSPPTIVISYGLWVRRFERDVAVIGKTVAVDGTPMTVAGVTGSGFIGTDPTGAVDVWVPMGAARAVLPAFIDLDTNMRERQWVWIKLYARLKSGVSFEQASTEVQTIAARLRETYPSLKEYSIGWAVERGVGLDPDERVDLEHMSTILFGVVALLLALACANVSNLLLARATARKREMTVRLALGASRGRLVRQLLAESIVLAALGGLSGLLLSFWATAAISRFFADSSRFALALNLSPEWRVLAFTVAISGLTGIVFGIAPALHSSRTNLVNGMKESVALVPRPSQLRPLLVVTQLALSLVLLTGAGLLARTLWNFSQIRRGFDARDLALMSVEPTITHHHDEGRLHTFYERLLERVQALPGVESATLAGLAPVTARGWGVNAHLPDRPVSDPTMFAANNQFGLQYNTVAPNYFGMMGMAIVRGRGFTFQDLAASPRLMVINETMAQTIWPSEDPVGKQVFVADETTPRQVIGVVADLKHRSLLEAPRRFAYFSMWQPYPVPDVPTVIHLRTRMPLAQAAAAVLREVQTLDPNLAIFDVKTISDHIADSYWRQRTSGQLIAIFASLALVLGMTGMYSVMSYAVVERTHEIGIRMALGADANHVVRQMVLQGTIMIGCGVAAGTAGSLAATRLLKTLLYGVQERDPVVMVAAIMILATAGLLASYVPARRAASIDPMVALRYE